MQINMTKRQKQFCDASAFEVLYGGAAGGGKSYAQLLDAFIYAMKYAGSKQIIFRRTLPELEKSLIRVSQSIFSSDVYSYRRSVHTGTFINGSLIDFAYCDSEDDVYRYQSAEYDVIRFDELTHFTSDMYVYLISRCRGANGFPKQIKSTTNPGGIGHSWVKKRFIDVGAPEKVHTVGQTDRIFIPATVFENKFLMQSDPDYVKRLCSLDERDRKALLDGCWDLESGRFFEGFDRKLHTCAPFETEGATYYITLDYGLDMLACYLIALDGFDRAYVLRELYEGKDSGGEGLIVRDAAARIKELCDGVSVRAYFAPPDLWNRQKDSGKSIAQLFHGCGIPLTRVSNDRAAGWLGLKEWLAPEKCEDGITRPRLIIFENCVNLIRAMGALQCDKTRPADCAKTPHELTHAPDALRYFVSGNPRFRGGAPPISRYSFSSERPKRSALGYGQGYKII